MSPNDRKEDASVDHRPFGICCRRLKSAIEMAPTRTFRIEENGVLFMVVRVAETPDGPASFNAPVHFCPFCGTQLQSRESIAQAGCINVPSN